MTESAFGTSDGESLGWTPVCHGTSPYLFAVLSAGSTFRSPVGELMAARLSVRYWRDIPVSVSAQHGRTRHEVELPRRFQRTVELAAGSPTVHTSHGWWTQDRLCTDDLELEVTAEICRLESLYSRNKLGRLAQSGGFDEYQQRNRLQVVRTAS